MGLQGLQKLVPDRVVIEPCKDASEKSLVQGPAIVYFDKDYDAHFPP